MMSGETHDGSAQNRSRGMSGGQAGPMMPSGMHDGMTNCPMAQPTAPPSPTPPAQSTPPVSPSDPHQR